MDEEEGPIAESVEDLKLNRRTTSLASAASASERAMSASPGSRSKSGTMYVSSSLGKSQRLSEQLKRRLDEFRKGIKKLGPLQKVKKRRMRPDGQVRVMEFPSLHKSLHKGEVWIPEETKRSRVQEEREWSDIEDEEEEFDSVHSFEDIRMDI